MAHGKYIGRLVRTTAVNADAVDYPQEARDQFHRAVEYFE